MPELPEVETVARGLCATISGETFSSVKIIRPQSVEFPKSARGFARGLSGRRVESVSRRGKYILMELSGNAILAAHLRMSGRLLVKPSSAKRDRFLRVLFHFENGLDMHFEDMRVFGRLWFIDNAADLEKRIPALAILGVEPLVDLEAHYLADFFKKKKLPVKSALLDQRIIAGIGNIYADECLFLSRIHPLRPVNSLLDVELELLVDKIKSVLSKAIELGGSSLKDYKDAHGVNGNYQSQAWVYGRDGQSCRSCSQTITRIKLSGRSTHYCPGCQIRSKPE